MDTNDIQISLPASKSLSNRWVVVNYLLKGQMQLRNLSTSDDTQLLRLLLRQLNQGGDSVYYCHNAGTVARFLLPLLCLRAGSHTLTGSERLCQRPISELVEALQSLGYTIRYLRQPGQLPVQVDGGSVPQRKQVTIVATRSSQFVSALMLMALALPMGLTINIVGHLTSRPYIDLTAYVLREAGATVSVSPNGHICYVTPPPQLPLRKTITIENDWSSASYFYAISSLLPGVRIRLRNLPLPSVQGDCVAERLFAQLGVRTQLVKAPYRRQVVSLCLVSDANQRQPQVNFNFTDAPDLLPAVAVACAALGIDARLRGFRTLKDKECDRIEALRSHLQQMGVRVQVTDQVMRLFPSAINPQGTIDSCGDHRIAMAFATLMVLNPELRISQPEVVSKSFPDFWKQMEQLGIALGMNLTVNQTPDL
ncbi:MAG: hypothetical protein KBT04_04935 [Bacteroidales bacterium]|nr:hypothetical protein [Candidatus Colimorpha onthohippi]